MDGEAVASFVSAIVSAVGSFVGIVVYCREVHTATIKHPGGIVGGYVASAWLFTSTLVLLVQDFYHNVGSDGSNVGNNRRQLLEDSSVSDLLATDEVVLHSLIFGGLTMVFGPYLIMIPSKKVTVKPKMLKSMVKGFQKEGTRRTFVFIFWLLTMIQGIVVHSLYTVLRFRLNVNIATSVIVCVGYSLVLVVYLVVYYVTLVGSPLRIGGVDILKYVRSKITLGEQARPLVEQKFYTWIYIASFALLLAVGVVGIAMLAIVEEQRWEVMSSFGRSVCAASITLHFTLLATFVVFVANVAFNPTDLLVETDCGAALDVGHIKWCGLARIIDRVLLAEFTPTGDESQASLIRRDATHHIRTASTKVGLEEKHHFGWGRLHQLNDDVSMTFVAVSPAYDSALANHCLRQLRCAAAYTWFDHGGGDDALGFDTHGPGSLTNSLKDAWNEICQQFSSEKGSAVYSTLLREAYEYRDRKKSELALEKHVQNQALEVSQALKRMRQCGKIQLNFALPWKANDKQPSDTMGELCKLTEDQLNRLQESNSRSAENIDLVKPESVDVTEEKTRKEKAEAEAAMAAANKEMLEAKAAADAASKEEAEAEAAMAAANKEMLEAKAAAEAASKEEAEAIAAAAAGAQDDTMFQDLEREKAEAEEARQNVEREVEEARLAMGVAEKERAEHEAAMAAEAAGLKGGSCKENIRELRIKLVAEREKAEAEEARKKAETEEARIAKEKAEIERAEHETAMAEAALAAAKKTGNAAAIKAAEEKLAQCLEMLEAEEAKLVAEREKAEAEEARKKAEAEAEEARIARAEHEAAMAAEAAVSGGGSKEDIDRIDRTMERLAGKVLSCVQKVKELQDGGGGGSARVARLEEEQLLNSQKTENELDRMSAYLDKMSEQLASCWEQKANASELHTLRADVDALQRAVDEKLKDLQEDVAREHEAAMSIDLYTLRADVDALLGQREGDVHQIKSVENLPHSPEYLLKLESVNVTVELANEMENISQELRRLSSSCSKSNLPRIEILEILAKVAQLKHDFEQELYYKHAPGEVSELSASALKTLLDKKQELQDELDSRAAKSSAEAAEAAAAASAAERAEAAAVAAQYAEADAAEAAERESAKLQEETRKRERHEQEQSAALQIQRAWRDHVVRSVYKSKMSATKAAFDFARQTGLQETHASRQESQTTARRWGSQRDIRIATCPSEQQNESDLERSANSNCRHFGSPPFKDTSTASPGDWLGIFGHRSAQLTQTFVDCSFQVRVKARACSNVAIGFVHADRVRAAVLIARHPNVVGEAAVGSIAFPSPPDCISSTRPNPRKPRQIGLPSWESLTISTSDQYIGPSFLSDPGCELPTHIEGLEHNEAHNMEQLKSEEQSDRGCSKSIEFSLSCLLSITRSRYIGDEDNAKPELFISFALDGHFVGSFEVAELFGNLTNSAKEVLAADAWTPMVLFKTSDADPSVHDMGTSVKLSFQPCWNDGLPRQHHYTFCHHNAFDPSDSASTCDGHSVGRIHSQLIKSCMSIHTPLKAIGQAAALCTPQLRVLLSGNRPLNFTEQRALAETILMAEHELTDEASKVAVQVLRWISCANSKEALMTVKATESRITDSALAWSYVIADYTKKIVCVLEALQSRHVGLRASLQRRAVVVYTRTEYADTKENLKRACSAIESCVNHFNKVWPAVQILVHQSNEDDAGESPSLIEDFDALVNSIDGAGAIRLTPGLKQKVLMKLRARLEPKFDQYDFAKWLDWDDLAEFFDSASTVEDLTQNVIPLIVKMTQASARNVAIDRVRSLVEPELKLRHLAWEDVVPVLEKQMQSKQDLSQILADPEVLLQKVLAVAGPAAKQFAIKLLRPVIEPRLRRLGLQWNDAVPVLREIDTLQELQVIQSNPAPLFSQLLKASGAPARQMLIQQLRLVVEPRLEDIGLKWSDVAEPLTTLELKQIEQVMIDPDSFLQETMSKLRRLAGPAAKQMLIARLKSQLQPLLAEEYGEVHWADVTLALEITCTVADLHSAMSDPEGLIGQLCNCMNDPFKVSLQETISSTPAMKRMLVAKLRPQLEPKLPEDVQWIDVVGDIDFVPVDWLENWLRDPEANGLNELSSLFDLPEICVEDLQARVDVLPTQARHIAVRAILRQNLRAVAKKNGLLWDDIVDYLDTDSASLAAAHVEPYAFFMGLLNAADLDGTGAMSAFTVAKLRPQLEPLLREAGFQWEFIRPLIAAAGAMVDDLQSGVLTPDDFVQSLLTSCSQHLRKLVKTAKWRVKGYSAERAKELAATVAPAFVTATSEIELEIRRLQQVVKDEQPDGLAALMATGRDLYEVKVSAEGSARWDTSDCNGTITCVAMCEMKDGMELQVVDLDGDVRTVPKEWARKLEAKTEAFKQKLDEHNE